MSLLWPRKNGDGGRAVNIGDFSGDNAGDLSLELCFGTAK